MKDFFRTKHFIGYEGGLQSYILLIGFLIFSAFFLYSPLAQAKIQTLRLSGDQDLELTTSKAFYLELPRDAHDVLVANPEVAEIVIKTPRTAYLIALKPGSTNAFFLDGAGKRILSLDIQVENDLAGLRKSIKDLLPDIDVKVQSSGGDIILSGQVPSAAVAENVRQLARRFVNDDKNIVNLLKITNSEQVLIKVRVTEMRRSVVKQLGLSFSGRGGDVSFKTGASATGATALFNDHFASALITGNILGFSNLDTLIEALEKDGYVKTLAEPNLTALSGEEANFLAGGEFPVPVSRDDAGRITIDFKPFGVGLKFTPVVLDSNHINLRILTEVSSLSSDGAFNENGVSIPALAVRRAQTTVEIPSGGSLVLGGLLRNDTSNQINSMPILGDVPILGALFRSTDFQRDETELVVIAIPYVVKPARPADLVSPTDHFSPATDLDQFFLGKLYERYSSSGMEPPSETQKVGYILD